ncbi:putative extracellular nuclease [Pacificitalea manganoxidans]|nr:putative extracellular nuclease [Pacificitalea manganoxidans]
MSTASGSGPGSGAGSSARSGSGSDPAPGGRLRIATYNVEWFDALFDDAGRMHDDARAGGRHGIDRATQTAALGRVFAALDADAVLVVEAPDTGTKRSTITALENFATRFDLRARACLMGFANDTQQELALLYDPDRLTPRHAPQDSDGAPRFDGSYRIDLDIDATLDHVRFSKPPLEVALHLRGAEVPLLHLIGVHVKSKAPHGARSEADVTRLAIANRRKQLAQCIWLRHRVEAHLAQGTPLVVLGDFNDGPGLDDYEALFGRSGLEIVLGHDAPAPARLYDPHARRALAGAGRPTQAQPTSARFWIAPEERYLSALLDYIMVSPDLAARQPRWRIWHPFDAPEIYRDAALREALLAASDHFPVTLDLPL